MRTNLIRRVALGALALLTTLTVVAPVQGREPLRKLEPRRTVPYRVGRVFTPNTDVLSVSGYAAWMIDEALALTTPLPRLGAAFMRAERDEGINARYFVAHAMLESGWGTSAIARYKRNLFGYNAYDRDPWKYARRFASHARGVATVAAILRESYLTPGGLRWYGFTTLRGINRYYASDVHWADKVAVLANVIDYLVVTLRERGVRFRRPVLLDRPVAGARAALEIPWTSNPGAELPDALRFAARWTPVAVVEASAQAPAEAPGAPWRFARRSDGPDQVVRLDLTAPALPGLWRLDVEARDSDGRPLPKTDRPLIRSLEVRVVAPGEVGVALAVGDDGNLAATVSVAGVGREVEAAAAVRVSAETARAATARAETATAAIAGEASPTQAMGAGTTLEVWTLPLDPDLVPYVALVSLPDALGPAAPWTTSLGAPAVPAVVVARVVGAPGSVVGAAPTVALAGRDADGRLTLTRLTVASPRDDLLLARPAAVGPIVLRSLDEPGSVEVAVSAGDPPPVISAAVAAVEEAPGPLSVLVRTLDVDSASPAAPTDSLAELPGDVTGAARLSVSGLPAGVRLVMAGLVPRDGGPVDPATLSFAWIAVKAISEIGTTRE
jgi:hypothetical protein